MLHQARNYYDPEPDAKPKPPEHLTADIAQFHYLGTFSDDWKTFRYRHRSHTAPQVLEPHYFFSIIDRNIARGDEITCLLGPPESAIEMTLLVCAIDRRAKTVRLSKRDSRGKYTYVGSDAIDVHDDPKAA